MASLPLSAGIMTGCFYSVSTLLNQMIMACYEVIWLLFLPSWIKMCETVDGWRLMVEREAKRGTRTKTLLMRHELIV